MLIALLGTRTRLPLDSPTSTNDGRRRVKRQDHPPLSTPPRQGSLSHPCIRIQLRNHHHHQQRLGQQHQQHQQIHPLGPWSQPHRPVATLYTGTVGVVYVVDSSDEAKTELTKVAMGRFFERYEKLLRKAMLLVLVNKQDPLNALSVTEVNGGWRLRRGAKGGGGIFRGVLLPLKTGSGGHGLAGHISEGVKKKRGIMPYEQEVLQNKPLIDTKMKKSPPFAVVVHSSP